MAKISDGSTYLGKHLCANDYYSEKETVSGHWVGKGATLLGLHGEIEAGNPAFENLRTNRLPCGSGKLTERDGENRVRFLDFQCSCPKSVSVMAVTMGDSRLVEIHQQASRKALGELERFATCQCNTLFTRNSRTTGNLVVAEFTHTASRALDPQVHSHFVTANATWDDVSNTWKALNEYDMLSAIRYGGKVYQNELAKGCRELGYEIVEVTDGKGSITGFEIKGVSAKIIERYSKRRREIEEGIHKFERQNGRTPTTQEIHVITKETRNAKLDEITTPDVLDKQRAQLSRLELQDLETVKEIATGRGVSIPPTNREHECLQMAVAHLFERRSVVHGYEVLAEALNRGLGQVDLNRLDKKMNAYGLVELNKNEGSNPLRSTFATEKGLALERWSVDFVNRTCGKFDSIIFEDFSLSQSLSDEQRQAVELILKSRDQVVCLRGAAGVGKTTVLKEMDRVLQSNNRNCWYCAPTSAAAETLRHEGIKQATTVADFLINISIKENLKNSVIIIDEAGLASNKQGAEILLVAQTHEARVIFIGDSRQHSAVEAGDFLRVLENHSNILRGEIVTIRRQLIKEYRQAIQEMATGGVQGGLKRLDKLGWVHEGRAGYIEAAAKTYLQHFGDGQKKETVIAVAPTWEESHALTDSIRRGLKDGGILSQGN